MNGHYPQDATRLPDGSYAAIVWAGLAPTFRRALLTQPAHPAAWRALRDRGLIDDTHQLTSRGAALADWARRTGVQR